jgi:hypothetical protein
MEPKSVSPEVEEQAKHVAAIASISEQHHLAAETVAEVYGRELARISRDALITTYLPIFVTRRVNDLLRSLSAQATQVSEDRPLNLAH